MKLITDPRAIDRLQARLRESLSTASPGNQFMRFLGHRGGGFKAEIHWHQHEQIWYAFVKRPDRYLNLFGTDDPATRKNVSITCETNVARSGNTKGLAGVFARDAQGAYLLHSGRIGGGEKGIGPKLFWREWGLRGLPRVTVADSAGSKDYAVVAGMREADLADRVIRFARDVSAIRAARTGTADHGTGDGLRGFSPEGEGVALYSVDANVAARRRHAVVVNELERLLRRAKIPCGNNRIVAGGTRIDLFCPTRDPVRAIFEVKPDNCRGSIYSAIGQLLLGAHGLVGEPLQVLVCPSGVPGAIPPNVVEALRGVGIYIQTFVWKEGRPIFESLESLIEKLRSA